MSWFLGAMTRNFDTDVIANGRGSLDFLRFFKTTFSKNTFAIFPTNEKLVTVLLVHKKIVRVQNLVSMHSNIFEQI